MQSIKPTSFLLIFSLFIFSSCDLDDGNSYNDDDQNNNPDNFSQYFGNEISRDFIGTVVDKNNNPIPGTTITIGDDSALTDGNGIFIISNADVNERFGYIKAEKAGYIQGSRSVVPSNGTNNVTIMLLEANVIGSVNSGSTSAISLANGSSVSFDGNFIKEDGSAYSGTVDVIMHHLDPANEDMQIQMPGMLYAQNEDGAERMLQTLGMLAVELRGSNGEELNIAEGAMSEIKIPVDASLMPIAPATIPLWYFDEEHGYWKEEGEATLQGNMYVGNVSHFSFWNCDIQVEANTLCVTVTDENGTALNYLSLEITSLTFGSRGGVTNENGEVCGFVPSGEVLELVIRNSNCGDGTIISTQTIGPFTTDSSITIEVTEGTNLVFESIVGSFNTCNGTAVEDGYVQMNYNEQLYTYNVNDGSFEFNLIRCNSDDTIFSIKGTDYTNIQSTDTVNFTFTTPSTNTGIITACNSVSEYVQYTIGDNDTVLYIENITATLLPLVNPIYPLTHELEISGSTFSGGTTHGFNVGLWPYAPGFIGTYGVDDVWFTGSGNGQFFVNTHTLTISSLGEVGDYIDVNFSGSLSGSNGIQPISGVMHVLRDE